MRSGQSCKLFSVPSEGWDLFWFLKQNRAARVTSQSITTGFSRRPSNTRLLIKTRRWQHQLLVLPSAARPGSLRADEPWQTSFILPPLCSRHLQSQAVFQVFIPPRSAEHPAAPGSQAGCPAQSGCLFQQRELTPVCLKTLFNTDVDIG